MHARRSHLVRIVAGPAIALALLVLAPGPAQAAKPACEYKVAKGDTLSGIARRKGVSEANLLRANPVLKKNPNRLRVGQTLKICAAKQLQSSRPQACGKGGRIIRHTVGRGETLGGIAAHYSVSRDSVRKQNKQLASRPNSMIRVGESLKICSTNRRDTHRAWLKDGIQLPTGDGYNVRRPNNAWGTPIAVAGITAAIARYRDVQPDAPDVQIGDLSRSNGGPLRSHMSHQDGRDVDIGYVFAERQDETQRRELDLARTWALIRSFVEDDNLAVIFMDYRLQGKLHAYAKSIGVDEARLGEIFEYPRDGDREARVYHWPGHTMHFHVRFKPTQAEADAEAEAEAEQADEEPVAPDEPETVEVSS